MHEEFFRHGEYKMRFFVLPQMVFYSSLNAGKQIFYLSKRFILGGSNSRTCLLVGDIDHCIVLECFKASCLDILGSSPLLLYNRNLQINNVIDKLLELLLAFEG